MKSTHLRLVVCLLVSPAAHAALSPQDVLTLPTEKIVAEFPKAHPSAYLLYASRLWKEDQKEEAVFWYYVGSIRYRFDLATKPDQDRSGDPALFASLQETVGRPINQYAGGHLKMWLTQIDRAVAWDEATANEFTSKTQFKVKLQEVRDGLAKLREWVASHVKEIEAERVKNGLGK